MSALLVRYWLWIDSLRHERKRAIVLGTLGYLVCLVADLPIWMALLNTIFLIVHWWVEELAWATTWPLRWWYGLTREDFEEDTTP